MYRDALEAAHRRIAELEAQLFPKPKKKRRSGAAIVGVGVASVVIAFAIVALAARSHRYPIPPPPSTPVPAPTQLALAHDYTDALLTPFTADVDGDGVEDVVAKFRKLRNLQDDVTDEQVYVRAVSGASFAPLWTTGPFDDAGPSNVAVVGDRVVVTTRDGARILLLRNGVEQNHFATTMKSACAAVDKPGIALLLPDVAVDVHTGAVTKPAPTDRCVWTAPNTCAVSGEPCLATDASVPAHKARVHGWTTLRDGPNLVSYGWILPSREHMFAAGERKNRFTSWPGWEREATLEGEPVVEIEHVTNYQSMMAALDGDRFVLAYGVASGIRVVARNADTGILRWETLLADHPRNAALRTTHARIYVHSDWHITVLDGSSGAALGTIGE